jgi:hypothetical protein
MSIYRDLLAQSDNSESITAAGAAGLTYAHHYFTAASAAYTTTLAAGQPGQLAFFKMVSNGATHVVTLTPASARSFTSYTFNAVGEWLILRYRDNAWERLDSNNATKVA